MVERLIIWVERVRSKALRLRVSVFLTSSCVDLVRKRATQVQPLDPLANLVRDFLARGGTLWAYTPCVKARGYAQEDLVDGTVVTAVAALPTVGRR